MSYMTVILGAVIGWFSLELLGLAESYMTVGYGLHPLLCGFGISILVVCGACWAKIQA